MTSRAAPSFDANEEPPSKRPRIQQEDTTACLDSLNDDCLVHILTHTATEDLNSFACSSKRCQKARAHDSLDQARTGTITIAQGGTLDSLCEAIIEGNWDEDFQGNQTTAIIDRLERMGQDETIMYEPHDFPLSGVTKLQLKSSPGTDRHDTDEYLVNLFPNLQEVDLSSLNTRNEKSICSRLSVACHNLNKLTWNRNDSLSLLGTSFYHAPRLADLCLNNCQFKWNLENVQTLSSSSTDDDYYLFVYCRHLERLSIKNATWKMNASDESDDGEIHSVSQGMLIKMVRRHPTLRWLQSDLSEGNVRMLQQERPEITFVSD